MATLSQIEAIPRLFISDRFSARSKPLLQTHNITHVLSVTRVEDLPFKPTTEVDFSVKHVDLDDDPTEDLLGHLDGICDWIDEALLLYAKSGSRTATGAVLVHCNQGVSRSGSVIVAYLMKSCSLPYESALRLARESRSLIDPNIGFENQLRIWGQCQYSAFIWEDGVGLVPKPEYQEWKREIERIYMRGDIDEIQKAKTDWIRGLINKLRG